MAIPTGFRDELGETTHPVQKNRPVKKSAPPLVRARS